MKPRILVIDDEQSIRFTFKRFLLGAGYDVETAESYGEGLGWINESDFDMIFADIVLRGETGLDLLRAVRAKELVCPLVFITGRPDLKTAAEAVRLGAFDYLPKPVLKETLLHVAGKALHHKTVVCEKEQCRSNLEAIFNSVKDVIVMVNEDMAVIELNEAASHLCGFSRDLIGKPLTPLLKGCNGRCLDALKAAIKRKTPAEVQRFECAPRCMPKRIVSVTASPLLHSHGELTRAVMVARDETRLVDLERALNGRQSFHRIIGKSEKMQVVYSLIENLADVRTSVLITGESGTGKELLAEAIHREGNRKEKPLVKVNCSALSEGLLESELFGHVKGAFTGAIKDKTGRFQLADGGTLFLDEIGDISPGTQQRLLRVLQEREFERVGDSTPIRVDARVIAATNKNLLELVRRGQFREDLYYRLKVVEVTLPPLRERKEDIPLLVNHFVLKFNAGLHKTIEGLSDDALKTLMNCPWPGNVRQLAHALEHAFITCRRNIITIADLPADVTMQEHLPPSLNRASPEAQPPKHRKRKLDAETVTHAFETVKGNKIKAAALLGVSRSTLYRFLDTNLDLAEGASD